MGAGPRGPERVTTEAGLPGRRPAGRSVPCLIQRRPADDRPGQRVAKLAWFDLAEAATRLAILREILTEEAAERTPPA